MLVENKEMYFFITLYTVSLLGYTEGIGYPDPKDGYVIPSLPYNQRMN